MADQEQLAAFAYHWRAAGLAETTLRYYLSWLGRLDVDDATTDDWLAAQLADMTPSQRQHAQDPQGAGCTSWTVGAGVVTWSRSSSGSC